MPFCCQCGRPAGIHDVYCASCGARQPAPAPVTDYLYGVSPRTASLLCYIPILGWIVAIVILASARFRGDTRVRFHAFQGLYLFVAWLIVDWVLSPMFHFASYGGPPFHKIFPGLMQVAILCAWIFMIIKTAHDEVYKLPILGDLTGQAVSKH